MRHAPQVAENFYFLFRRPLAAVTRLHQQGHHATCRCQFTQNTADFPALGKYQLLPPTGKPSGARLCVGHGQPTLASEFLRLCQPRQTNIPRFVQRQARFGPVITTTATASPTSAGWCLTQSMPSSALSPMAKALSSGAAWRASCKRCASIRAFSAPCRVASSSKRLFMVSDDPADVIAPCRIQARPDWSGTVWLAAQPGGAMNQQEKIHQK